MTSSPRVEPVWLDSAVALAIHDRQLAEHGGSLGLRDAGLLESALARPVNRWAYGAISSGVESPRGSEIAAKEGTEDDAAALAAAYAFGVARNHPFADGNKRTAWVLARLFLALNGHELRFAPEEAIAAMLALAAGELSEEEMADWFRSRLRR